MTKEMQRACLTEIDVIDYTELLYSLRDKEFKKLTNREIVTGEHRNGCGSCTLIKRVSGHERRFYVIKPHPRCSAVECIGVEWCTVTSSRHTAPREWFVRAQENNSAS